jgi:hypothetical protein
MSLKLGYRPDEAANLLGSEQLLRECVQAGWIEPTIQRNKLTLYDGSDLVGCWARIRKGEMPPRIERKKKEAANA